MNCGQTSFDSHHCTKHNFLFTTMHYGKRFWKIVYAVMFIFQTKKKLLLIQ